MNRKRLCSMALPMLLAACANGAGDDTTPVETLPHPVKEKAVSKIDTDDLLAPHRAAFEASRRAMLEIELEAMPTDDPLASKVGGRPYLPPGESAPLAGDGRPLFLLAQINFADAPPLAGYPDQGLLQFFIAADDHYGADFDGPVDMDRLARQDGFRVMYRSAPLAPAAPSASPRAVSTDSLPFDPARPRRMRFAPGSETISTGDVRFPIVAGGDPYALADAYARQHRLDPDTVTDALQERLGASGHKLGGYPFFTQADPRRPEDPHVLLLQLDTDEAMMWGDSGVANFFIPSDDLARRDFSRVAYHWDCY